MSYVAKLDNTNWESVGGSGVNTWDGSKWTISAVAQGGANMGLSATSSGSPLPWVSGFRPANLRITMSCVPNATLHLEAFNVAGQDYINVGQTSPTPVAVTSTPQVFVLPLDFTPTGNTMDIGQIGPYDSSHANDWVLTIHNIEFGDGSAPAAFWTDFDKTREVDA